MGAHDMLANSTTCETLMVNACSSWAHNHCQMTTRVVAARSIGTSVRPTGAFRTRPARTVSGPTAVGGISARAWQHTGSSSGFSCSWSPSHLRCSSLRGITSGPGARQARSVCLAMGGPGSADQTRGLSKRLLAYRGSSSGWLASRSKWLRNGCAMQHMRYARGGDTGMYL